MTKGLPASRLRKTRVKKHMSKLGFMMLASPSNEQIPLCCPAFLTSNRHKPTTCCPRSISQDHQAKNDQVSVACGFLHVTRDGSELPTAHGSHKNAQNIQLFARTCSERVLTHCSTEIAKEKIPPSFPST